MQKQNESNDFQGGKVATIAFGHAVHDTYSAFLPPMLPLIIQNLTLSNTQAGFLSFSMQTVSIIQPLIGRLADNISLRYLVIFAPGITATFMSLLGITPTYLLMILLMLLVGLSSAGIHTVGPAMIGRLSGKTLGLGMSIWMVGGELGRAIGPIVIVTAIKYLSLENTPILMILGWAATILLFIRLKNVSGKPETEIPTQPWRDTLSSMRQLLIPLIGIITFSGFLLACTSTYLPVFLTDEGADLWFAGASLTILETAGVIGAFTAGSISDRAGRKVVLFIAMIFSPIFMLLFLRSNGILQILFLLFLGFTAISTTPVMMAMIQENYPENRAFANGTYNAISFAIRSLDIVFVGLLSDHLGLRTTFVISAIVMIFCIPIIFAIPGKNNSSIRPAN